MVTNRKSGSHSQVPTRVSQISNPFTPGAGFPPPHLAGRENEINKFAEFLSQTIVLKNPIYTGLRGIGKTVLLTQLQPLTEQAQWTWVGTDLSEAAFVNEEAICRRIITDLSFYTSSLSVRVPSQRQVGIAAKEQASTTNLSFSKLWNYFQNQPGLNVDKLKAVFDLVWPHIEKSNRKGIVFAYDEAQVVTDHRENSEYPLSLMLGLFQSIQRKGVRVMLLLAGLPTIFPRLVAARTYAERMFSVHTLGKLDKAASRAAIERPLRNSSLKFPAETVEEIVRLSGGYPYFLQFLGRECFDHFKLQLEANPSAKLQVPIDTILAKLDSDFFAGRWDGTTDRQRELLFSIASLESSPEEFGAGEIADISADLSKSKKLSKFSKGDIAQALPRLIERGLIYKTRHGKYSFAIPMFADFIKRQFH